MPAKPVPCRARVTAVRALASEVLEADLAMIDPPSLSFEAGQWVSVPFGPKRVRAYSIASTPRASSAITLCADVAPDGPGSRWFRGLTLGSEIEFKGLYEFAADIAAYCTRSTLFPSSTSWFMRTR
jgi:ferredoxin-NADP reductase